MNFGVLPFCPEFSDATSPDVQFQNARKVINQSWPLVGLQNNDGFSSDILVVRWFLQANATKRGQPLGTHVFFSQLSCWMQCFAESPTSAKALCFTSDDQLKGDGPPLKKPCGASINAIAKRLENSVSSMVYERYNYSNHGVPTSYHWMIYPIPVAKDFRWKSNIPLETGHV